MRYLTVEEVLALHSRLIATSGGSLGVRDANALASAVAQPQMTFSGIDLYETIARKAAALGHSLISNHPFVDGNKRIGHAAMEVMLLLNGYQIVAAVDDQEETILAAASGTVSREDFASRGWSDTWLSFPTAQHNSGVQRSARASVHRDPECNVARPLTPVR